MRDEIVDFITYWTSRLEVPVRQLLTWLKLPPSRFYDWLKRKNQGNRHNGLQPKQHWLLPDERNSIVAYAQLNPNEGYRRLTYMMLDANVVAVSPSSVYRVLKAAHLLMPSESKPSKKGTGFIQPTQPHEHWHVDIFLYQHSGYILLSLQPSGWL